MDIRLELVVLPVSDVDRAADFYTGLGFRKDLDHAGAEGFRIVHLTPPGSPASIVIGDGVTDAVPGSARGIHLVVEDIVAMRKELVARGVDASEIFHDAGGLFHHAGMIDRVAGPHPDRRSYGSFLSFEDPDGNGFVVQEVTDRIPGRIDAVVYRSADDVERALRNAAIAHGRHEAEIGHEDPQWPAWYAAHMTRAAGLEPSRT
ncbi:glyoxalase [Actinomycetospora sp. NBRC 106375]|uniref:VOC family protein n=1 Tax=Actinomycetospora sp. NBRC 106375 TaxID=3032207 RepID=UPI0024A57C9A|nr:VOC family protein [Actinomycetospora sp. NBRC 106375]GLZ48850.1 glyoxalase [Actinomycetospora sp. NBRC 106375]